MIVPFLFAGPEDFEENRPSIPKSSPSNAWQVGSGGYERMQECSRVAVGDAEWSELCGGRELRGPRLGRADRPAG